MKNSTERPDHWGPPVINPTDISKIKSIGSGQYGEVFQGRCRGTDVAVKVPIRQTLSKDELDGMKQEVFTMSQIYHPNIVLFMGASLEPNHIAIVTELMKCDLHHFLRMPEGLGLTKGERIEMMIGAAKGMAWLHENNNKVHRDLKPANMLVDSRRNVKITDFGFTESLKGKTRDKNGPKGTFLWMAPEVMNEEEFDQSLDVYSFGLILLESWTGVEPFGEYEDYEEFFEAIVVLNKRPPLPDDAPPALNNLISRCWHHNAKNRPTFSKCVEELNEIRVDMTITDPGASKYWKQHYLKYGFAVPWSAFEKSFVKKSGIEHLKLFLLDPVSLQSKVEEVTLASFQHTCALVGRFFVPEQCKVIGKDLAEASEATWFFGFDTREISENALAKCQPGAYLVRVSQTEWKFILSSLKADKGFSHRKIITQVDADGVTSYHFAEHSSASLSALVNILADAFDLTVPPKREDTARLYY